MFILASGIIAASVSGFVYTFSFNSSYQKSRCGLVRMTEELIVGGTTWSGLAKLGEKVEEMSALI